MIYVRILLYFIFLNKYAVGSNLMQTYIQNEFIVDSKTNLSSLIHYVFVNYLSDCTPYVLYDDFFFETIVYRDALFETLARFRTTPIIHGFIDNFFLESLSTGKGRHLDCFHFIVFVNDLETILSKLDFQLTSRVVFIVPLSPWSLKEFLISGAARNIQNLLLISDPSLQKDNYLLRNVTDINLYTHRLHVDGIGSSAKKILTSWRQDRLTRPEVNLFPPKLDEGLNGHRLIVFASEQPPFVIRKNMNLITGNHVDSWDGIEINLLRLIAKSLKITLSIHDTVTYDKNLAFEEIVESVHKGIADIGISGIYASYQYYNYTYFSVSHSQDCAAFITLSSTAIPKYRAILGPFQWGVWLCVIFIYLFAVLPVEFSHKLTCRMFKGWGEVCSMFWVVFGTFSNLFTFRGEKSWNNYKNSSTRTVIGTYWIFTIIITAAYSSSIISFITIPTYFDVVDSVDDLIEEEFRVGTLNTRNWKEGFTDSVDNKTNQLFKNIEVVNSSIIGLEKVKKYKNFAFLGPRSYLSYAVRSNFSFNSGKKKSMYHITSECLVPFRVSFVMKPKADFLIKIDQQIQRFHENGLIEKISNDLDWAINRKSGGRLFMGASTGLKAEAPEDRQLTLDDVQGMFLLLGIGMNIAVVALVRECWMGYQLKNHRSPIPSIEVTSCSSSENNSLAEKIVAYCERAVSGSILVGRKRLSASIRRLSH